VFELSPNGSGGWTETILYSFGTNGGASDGAEPEGVIFDKSGNLYGPTLSGGNGLCDHDQSASCGTIFELSPNGSGGWAENVIYAFPAGGGAGWSPNPGLVFDQSGNLYGTTYYGGANPCLGSGGCGTVFELSPSGSGSWTQTLLYSFGNGSNDGTFPAAGAIFDQSGNLYGTTQQGGTGCGGAGGGCGTVFELSPSGSGWTENIAYSFQSGAVDGAYPYAELLFDQSGSLYSTTSSGFQGAGTVFELSPDGSGGWAETVLYGFQDGNGDGS
jgi:uncharacterized repeat protein (TIGR03803 family)